MLMQLIFPLSPAYNSINNADVNGAITWNTNDPPVNGNSYDATFIPTDNINYTCSRIYCSC